MCTCSVNTACLRSMAHCSDAYICSRAQSHSYRLKQLHTFEKHMSAFLRSDDRSKCYLIVVAEQSDDGRAFNRGQLLNVGFREAQKRVAPLPLDSVIFHDVDLLPSEGLSRFYTEPPKQGQPVHIAGPSTWGKYAQGDYQEVFFGGVTAIHPPDFEAANGYPNDYWGWGIEDDQLRLRVDASGGLARGVQRPPVGVGQYHDIDSVSMLPLMMNRSTLIANAHRFNQKYFDQSFQRGTLDPRWRHQNGLKGLLYDVLSRTERTLLGVEVYSVAVQMLHVTVDLISGDPDD